MVASTKPIQDRDSSSYDDTADARRVLLVDDTGAVIASGNALPVDIGSVSVTLNTSDLQIGAIEIKNSDSDVRASVVTKGSVGALTTQIVDSSGSQVESFGEPIYPSGTGANTAVTLSSANTAYAVPSSAPTSDYVLVIYNNSDTDEYWGFQNSNANGILLPPDGRVSLNMGANQVIYAYCGSAGKTIVASYKEVS